MKIEILKEYNFYTPMENVHLEGKQLVYEHCNEVGLRYQHRIDLYWFKVHKYDKAFLTDRSRCVIVQL